MQHVLCTGNLTAPAQMEAVMELAPNVHTVRGDCDEDETLPEETVVVIGSFRIGLCHGHQVSPAGSTQALAHLQRRMDVDVLVTGHTHQHSIVEYENKLFVNPGSVTGALSPSTEDVVPSFLLFAVKDKTINVYIYQVVDGKRTVTQAEFTKPDA
ncbi:vps29 [Symbiodinium sp. KB8]|nr:vps29 [Symbiodinium sp. KB8]